MITLDNLQKKLTKPPSKKTCTICGDEKEIKDFGKNSKMKDGRFNQCKDCLKVRDRRYSESNRSGKAGFFNPNEPAF